MIQPFVPLDDEHTDLFPNTMTNGSDNGLSRLLKPDPIYLGNAIKAMLTALGRLVVTCGNCNDRLFPKIPSDSSMPVIGTWKIIFAAD
jgi:hypothetical protein